MSLIYNSYLNDFFNDDYFGVGKRSNKQSLVNNFKFSTKCNIYKRDNSYVFDLFLPGFSRNDFDISIDNNILTIKGAAEIKSQKYIHQEFMRLENFNRSFSLPENADIDNVDADYTAGVLSLLVPMHEDRKSSAKKITVN